MAQKVGHHLIIEVGQWQASVDVGEDGKPAAVSFQADPRGARARRARHAAEVFHVL
jgi:hypothetical protein